MSQNAMQRAGSGDLTQFRGAHRDPNEITNLLETAQSQFNLVTPATTCAHVPEGFDVQMSAVVVEQADTYDPGGGKVALNKTALNRIAAAAGVSWDPTRSGRLDDGRDPHYCHYRAVGVYRHFDGTPVVIQGEKVMDLRDGSAALQGVRDGEVKMQRKFILEHAETKARLRAIRSMGVRTAYSRDDIKKPFVVARLAFTGRTEDAELRRDFARMSAAAALGAGSALYGQPAPQALPAPAGDPELGSLPAPPLDAAQPDLDEDERPGAPQSDPDPVVPAGRLTGAGRRVSELSDDELAPLRDEIMSALEHGMSEPKAARARDLLDAVTTEMSKRVPF